MSHLIKFKKNTLPMSVLIGADYLIPSNDIGYICGGYYSFARDSVQSFDMVTKVADLLSETLNAARDKSAGSNSLTKGYILGGYTNDRVNTIDELIFSNEVVSELTATLHTAIHNTQTANSGSVVYLMGGYTSSHTWSVYYFDYINETSGYGDDQMDNYRSNGVGWTNPLTSIGYAAAGDASSRLSVIDKYNYNSGSAVSVYEDLSETKYGGIGIQHKNIKGYWCGGYASSALSSIDSFGLTAEIFIAVTASLTATKYDGPGIYSLTKGYMQYYNTALDEFKFSDETCQSTSVSLDQSVRDAAGFQTSYI